MGKYGAYILWYDIPRYSKNFKQYLWLVVIGPELYERELLTCIMAFHGIERNFNISVMKFT